MKNLSRRSFLQNTPVTAATLSVLPAIPALAAAEHPPKIAATEPSARGSGSMVVHVNDVASGEMTILVGAREIALRDPGLVARLAAAAG